MYTMICVFSINVKPSTIKIYFIDFPENDTMRLFENVSLAE